MKGIVLLNGEPYTGEINCEDAAVYCCDGAYSWAKGKVRIDKNVGDFDSLSEIPSPPPEEIYPSEKNYTDGEIAVKQLIALGVDEIEIYGGGGRREDHFLGNLHLMHAAAQAGVKCSMYTENSVLFASTGKIFVGNFCGLTLSVLPFGAPLHIIDSRGLKYAYPDVIPYGSTRGISNVVQTRSAFVEVEGLALIVVNIRGV